MDGYRSVVARKILCMSTILTELFAGNFFTNKMPVNGMHVKFVRLRLQCRLYVRLQQRLHSICCDRRDRRRSVAQTLSALGRSKRL